MFHCLGWDLLKGLGSQIHSRIKVSYCHFKLMIFNMNQTEAPVDLRQSTFRVTFSSAWLAGLESGSWRCVNLLWNGLLREENYNFLRVGQDVCIKTCYQPTTLLHSSLVFSALIQQVAQQIDTLLTKPSKSLLTFKSCSKQGCSTVLGGVLCRDHRICITRTAKGHFNGKKQSCTPASARRLIPALSFIPHPSIAVQCKITITNYLGRL